MSRQLCIEFDSSLVDAISAEFDLRAPNKEALRELIYALNGDYDPSVMLVLNLATGVGKTYLMAAFMEYLRQQGVGNVVIVTPGKVVQAKTVQNFTMGSPRYIAGSPVPPDVVTPRDYSAWVARNNGPTSISYGRETPLLAFIFNIQQLIAPSSDEGETRGDGQQAQRRRPRKFDENAGVLFDYLRGLDDLVVIADESHLYSVSAAAFHGALEELDPSACIGLTASVQPEDHVIYTYPLYRAIEEQYVKAPVLAFRKGGYGEDTASEEQQLSDAMQLRAIKQQAYDAYAEHSGAAHLNAVMFVVCADTEHATQVTELLRTPRYFGKSLAVLQVDSNHDDAQTQLLLEDLDAADSPVLAVVSVNKLKEGWDVKNIAVVVTLRAMASEVLTQQTMGRGLRLPFGKYTGVLQIDQLDIISHQSFRDLLEAENVLQQFGLEEATENPQATNQGIKDVVARSQGMNAGVTGSVSSGNAREGGAWAAVPQDLDAEVQSVASVDAVQSASAAPVPDSPSQGMLFGGVGFMSIGEDGFAGQQALSYETVGRNQRFADVTYCFPRTTIKLVESPIDLSDVVEADIKAAAERVTSTGDILVRKQLKAALGGVLRAVDTESAEVDSLPVDDDSAEMILVRVVMDSQLVPATEANKRLARGYLVKKFMQYAPVDHWTVKALASADNELDGLVKGFVKGVLRNRTEKTALDPLAMPCKDALSLPLGGRCTSEWSRRPHSSAAVSTAVGLNHCTRRSRLTPTPVSTCSQSFWIRHPTSCGGSACIRNTAPSSTSTPRIATTLISWPAKAMARSGLSRARSSAAKETLSFRLSALLPKRSCTDLSERTFSLVRPGAI